MAEERNNGKKPRIRKTAPTIRERAETAQLEQDASDQKTSRLRRVDSKLHLSKNPVTKLLSVPLRLLKRVLRFIVPNYFINAWKELRLVSWPTRSETWRLTGAVFVFAIIFGAMVAGVDKVLDAAFKTFVLK